MSSERGEVQVSIIDFNIGGSYIKQTELQNLTKEILKYEQVSSSVIVNSITINDLYDLYKDKIFNSTDPDKVSNKFVLKIDIEGYEPHAFEQAKELFTKLDVVAVFLEFGKLLENLKKIKFDSGSDYLKRTKRMLRLLEDLNYKAYEPNGINMLDYKQWYDWPWDIYFRKCDSINCPGHLYKAVGVR